ncbi:HugZ family protein [Pseudogemmobacter hezensis]|uniref:HugZ family pyridoxamine 5'-phosphate oxidase n=1 Tax=Pseudogemmobacter hezensis TaxID=2737662 RepID=UPI0020A638F1|nr:pyridoxamine 5'-phosphate oxidase family protein [Pseudogemmobacter hezensis]
MTSGRTDIPPQAITPRSVAPDSRAGASFDPVTAGRRLLHESRIAALSTLDPGGFPYGIMTNVMPDADGSPVFLAARIALHARNLAQDNRASLCWAALEGADALTGPRMTLSGLAQPVDAGAQEALRHRYLARFPKARLYLQLPDALFFRLQITAVNIGGGPARNAGAVTFAQLGHHGAGRLLGADEAQLLQKLNRDPALIAGLVANTLRLRKGAAQTAWQRRRWTMVALDPDGFDLACSSRILRGEFAQPVSEPEGYGAALKLLLSGHNG